MDLAAIPTFIGCSFCQEYPCYLPRTSLLCCGDLNFIGFDTTIGIRPNSDCWKLRRLIRVFKKSLSSLVVWCAVLRPAVGSRGESLDRITTSLWTFSYEANGTLYFFKQIDSNFLLVANDSKLSDKNGESNLENIGVILAPGIYINCDINLPL